MVGTVAVEKKAEIYEKLFPFLVSLRCLGLFVKRDNLIFSLRSKKERKERKKERKKEKRKK